MLARALSTVRAGARPLSTAVLPDKPPIALFGIAGRYASAIYSAAAKKGELAQVDEDLKVGRAVGVPPVAPLSWRCAVHADPGRPRRDPVWDKLLCPHSVCDARLCHGSRPCP